MALLRVARAALCALLLLLLLAPTASAAARSSTYDARSFLLDGERVLILSGSIHYQRVLPADWPRALALAAEAGFNAVQTYVLWDMHEPERGNISFSGANDIVAFAAIAQSLGLRLDVRIGPYICGEHFNGGVPIWMRGAESGAECFRCRDAAWEAFTVHVLSAVVGELRRGGALWTQGGPVYLLQVENEYGGGELDYLKFCVAAARNETTDVPWLLCHDEDLCAAVNAGSASPLGDALCTGKPGSLLLSVALLYQTLTGFTMPPDITQAALAGMCFASLCCLAFAGFVHAKSHHPTIFDASSFSDGRLARRALDVPDDGEGALEADGVALLVGEHARVLVEVEEIPHALPLGRLAASAVAEVHDVILGRAVAAQQRREHACCAHEDGADDLAVAEGAVALHVPLERNGQAHEGHAGHGAAGGDLAEVGEGHDAVVGEGGNPRRPPAPDRGQSRRRGRGRGRGHERKRRRGHELERG